MIHRLVDIDVMRGHIHDGIQKTLSSTFIPHDKIVAQLDFFVLCPVSHDSNTMAA